MGLITANGADMFHPCSVEGKTDFSKKELKNKKILDKRK